MGEATPHLKRIRSWTAAAALLLAVGLLPSVSSARAATASWSLSPPTYDFGAVEAGTRSAPATLTLTNTGEVALPAPRVGVEFERPDQREGDESEIFEDDAFGCAIRSDLQPGESCAVTLIFQPVNHGPRSGTIRFVDPASELDPDPASATFTGVGIGPIVSFSPTGVQFRSLLVGYGPSIAQVLTLTNSGDVDLAINGISFETDGISPENVASASAGQFAVVGGSCRVGGTLAPGSNCTIQISFSPTVADPIVAHLRIVDNAAHGFQLIRVEGIGAAPLATKPSPLAIFFSQRPHKVSTRRFATFRFGVAGVRAQFVCKLDRRPFRSCVSPTTYRNLANGHHVFKVKALSPPPGVSPAPAVARFQVIPRRAG